MFNAIGELLGYTPYQWQCVAPIFGMFLAGTVLFLLFGGDAR